MSFQVTVGLLAHNSTVSRGAPVWWACRWPVDLDPESEVKWDQEGTSGRKREEAAAPPPWHQPWQGWLWALAVYSWHQLRTLGYHCVCYWSVCKVQTTVTNQEKKVNVSICVFLKCKWLSGKVIIAVALVKLKKKQNRKTSGMLLQAHVAPLAWTLLIQLQKMNITRVPGLLGQINLRHPFCAAGWKIFLAS